MYKLFVVRFVLVLALATASVTHASKDDDQKVTLWAQSILIDSLSASYRDTDAEIFEVQKYYSQGAWEPLNDFFHEELKIIKEQKLTVHPKALTPPNLMMELHCLKIPCWRVNQSFNLPELNMSIDFSLLMITYKNNFFIDSLNMRVRRY